MARQRDTRAEYLVAFILLLSKLSFIQQNEMFASRIQRNCVLNIFSDDVIIRAIRFPSVESV